MTLQNRAVYRITDVISPLPSGSSYTYILVNIGSCIGYPYSAKTIECNSAGECTSIVGVKYDPTQLGQYNVETVLYGEKLPISRSMVDYSLLPWGTVVLLTDNALATIIHKSDLGLMVCVTGHLNQDGAYGQCVDKSITKYSVTKFGVTGDGQRIISKVMYVPTLG